MAPMEKDLSAENLGGKATMVKAVKRFLVPKLLVKLIVGVTVFVRTMYVLKNIGGVHIYVKRYGNRM